MNDSQQNIVNTLVTIHTLHRDGDINDEQRNLLKQFALQEFEGF
jgi:hypothetical protein